MTVRPRTALAAVLLATTLTACGGGVSVSPGAPPEGVDGSWTLVSGRGTGGPLALFDGASVTLVVKGREISGDAACNMYSGKASRTGGFRVRETAVTEMGCLDDRLGTLESAYLDALWKVTRAEPSADRLVLTGDGVTLTFSRDAPVVDLPVEGTAWTLDTSLRGEAASSVVGRGTLLLDGGKVTGRGGCREFSGSYELSGSRLTMTGLRFVNDAAMDCTADAGRQDEEVLDVLGRPLTVTVEGSRLTLMAGGDGYSFSVPPPGQ